MKKLILQVLFVSVLALLSLGSLSAQVAADPLDFFYSDLEMWEAAGLVSNLPAARPYPMQLLKTILTDVAARGDAEQSRIAKAHYQRIFGQPLFVGYKFELATDMPQNRRQMSVSIAIESNLEIEEDLTASISIDGWATNKEFDQELLPLGSKSDKDIVTDDAKVGPFWVLPAVNSSVAYGSDEYYLHAGLMRASWGPFYWNGVIAGPQAIHSGQLQAVVHKKLWSYDLSMYALSATNGYGLNDDYAAEDESYKTGYSASAGTIYPSKYLTVHSINAHPVDWFSISIIESVMYGGRLEYMYMLPLSPYIISQGMTGFADNSYLGGKFTLKPMKGLKIDGLLYADDLSFNDMVRLQFDTKWRLAGQLGVTYSPPKTGLLALASVDYTMVTPYTYSHKTGEEYNLNDPNYQNYTHYGRSFGAALEPNSDRLNLRLKFRPLEGVDFDIVGTMIRHGNVNDGMDDRRIKEYLTGGVKYITDGSILNSSGTDGAGHAFNYSTPFLSQSILQYNWQTGFDINCRLPVLKHGGYMVFRLGYRFEANYNSGVNNRIYHYVSNTDLDTDISGTVEDSEIYAAAQLQYDAWKAQASGVEFNNYIRAGFEYYFGFNQFRKKVSPQDQ